MNLINFLWFKFYADDLLAAMYRVRYESLKEYFSAGKKYIYCKNIRLLYRTLLLLKNEQKHDIHRRVGWLAAPGSEPNQMQLSSWTWLGSIRMISPWILSKSWLLSKCSNWRSDYLIVSVASISVESEQPSTAWVSRVWRTGPESPPGAPWPAATAWAYHCGRGGWRGWGPDCLSCRQCTEPRQAEAVQQCSAMTTSWKKF